MEQIIHPTKAEALAELLTHTVGQLSNTVASFGEADFNRIPFEGSWTAAQVAEHVLKSMEFIHPMLNGPVEPTARNPEEHIVYLQEIMANMSVKAQSAPMLFPGEEPLNRSEIQERLRTAQNNFLADVRQLDLSETCTTLEFPGVGLMTRIEFISFAAFHAGRHCRQMENIHKIIEGCR